MGTSGVVSSSFLEALPSAKARQLCCVMTGRRTRGSPAAADGSRLLAALLAAVSMVSAAVCGNVCGQGVGGEGE